MIFLNLGQLVTKIFMSLKILILYFCSFTVL